MARVVLNDWTVARLRDTLNRRAHFIVEGRYITVVMHRERLYALDSACYHAAGPLGEGPVEDIEGVPCIRCPWHKFLVSLDRGEEVTVPVAPTTFDEDGVYRPKDPTTPPPHAGPPTRGRVVQRMHRVEEAPNGELFVTLNSENGNRESDIHATVPKRGGLCMGIADIKLQDHLEKMKGKA